MTTWGCAMTVFRDTWKERILREQSCKSCPYRSFDNGFVSRRAGYDCVHPLNGDHPTRIVDGPPSVGMPPRPSFCPINFELRDES